MKIESRFSPGDKAWVFNGRDGACQMTVGQVHVVVTDSPGIDDHREYANYSAQESRAEEYMCVETGIGSGQVYRLDKQIFATETECVAAYAERIAQERIVSATLREHDIERARDAVAIAKRRLESLGVAA